MTIHTKDCLIGEDTYPLDGCTRYRDGTLAWYLDGLLHREDGPAIVWLNGIGQWYRDGFRHREDGPAVIWANGTEEWFFNDWRHREGGPAVIWSNGREEWWVDGIRIKTKENNMSFDWKVEGF